MMRQIKLDDEQKDAVYSDENSSILVLAPPGSGKTLVMAKRIEYLISSGEIKNPFKILGLTFSNAAADEMKNRVTKEVPLAKDLVHITNFHSFAYSILKAYGNCVDLKRDFFVIGEIQSDELIKEVLGISDYFGLHKRDPRIKKAENCFYRYKKWKTERILKMNENYEDLYSNELFETGLVSFRNKLMSQNLLDFDHILYYTFKLLKSNNSVLNYYRSVFKYILVDEFQDTNPLQFAILKIMANGNNISKYKNSPVFILADPNQGIFEFQGAEPENVILAKDKFNCEEIKLKKDHRFKPEGKGIKILANAISNFIDEGTDKDLDISDYSPYYSVFPNKRAEADFITNKIKNLEENNEKLHEIAILAPQRADFEEIKGKLGKDKFVFVPDFRGPEIEKKYQPLFKSLREVPIEKKGKLSSLIENICKSNGIDANDEIIKILLNESKKYDAKRFLSKTLFEKVQHFTNETLLEVDWGKILKKQVKNKIFLSTIHSAKGLEFETVFVCGLQEGSLPNYSTCKTCHGTSDGLKQVKNLKLLNVGVSRGKKCLYLSSSQKNGWYYHKHSSCVLNPFYKYLNQI